VRHRFLVTFGNSPDGHKKKDGDEKTPEGSYKVCSKFRSPLRHKFIALDYPNLDDVSEAWRAKRITPEQHKELLHDLKKNGCPSHNTPLGGAVGIHSYTDRNRWIKLFNRLSRTQKLFQHLGLSDGCIVLSIDDLDKLYPLVEKGTPVVIHPIRRKRR
jgi:hypothetical protein